MRKVYKLASVYDTETTTLLNGAESKAFCYLYIFNDLTKIEIKDYEAGKSDDVRFYRYQSQALEYINNLIKQGISGGFIPIIAAYNLAFDLQTLMFKLSKRYEMQVCAQSSTNIYYLDLVIGDNVVLRFWDTFHLEMNGLAAMGDVAGLPKATGYLDYTKIRTPETPLTDDELFYCARDVQVIPAYLKYLLSVHEWLDETMFGVKVLTKTSLVRQMAQNEIGKLYYINKKGKRVKLLKAFEMTCAQNMPRSFSQYAIRKACFRGGFTFTSAKYASEIVRNVASLDVTSMHHLFINGRYVPEKFTPSHPRDLEPLIKNVLNTKLEYVLANYHKPFNCAFHSCVKFNNLRLKTGSAFAEYHIGLLAESKFKITSGKYDYGQDERAQKAEEMTRLSGWVDRAYHPVFAFGKLYEAKHAHIFVSELELYAMSLVYEWDSYEVICGESTLKFIKPPDYVTLQSHTLFEMKSDAKKIDKTYHEREPYTQEIPNSIPPGIAEQLRNGSMSNMFFSSWYNSTVKGMFNGIYGTQAQDVYKPDHIVNAGHIEVASETVLTQDNFNNLCKKSSKVLFQYGLRIVGGSRLHLVIAIEHLYRAFGSRIKITGGDTDSIKCALDESITSEEITAALEPLATASNEAIKKASSRVYKLYSDKASQLNGVGSFDIENDGAFYPLHMDAWNKCRVSYDAQGKSHVTAAGISRPKGSYTIENLVNDLSNVASFEEVAPMILSYNTLIGHSICHMLQRTHPSIEDMIDDDITDYLGNKSHVTAYEAIALYPSGREIGETSKRANAENIAYMKKLGKNVDKLSSVKIVDVIKDKPTLDIVGGETIIYE